MAIFGYLRVPSDRRTLASQLQALQAAGCKRIFQERSVGARADRPQLTRLLAILDKGDVVIVCRLDEIGRSTRELLRILEILSSRGVAFRSLHEHWADTKAPSGQLMAAVLGGLVEFERQLVRTRTGDGRRRALARGARTGRPPALNHEKCQEVLDALRTGTATQADLARRFNVSQSTVSRLADKMLLPEAKAGTVDATTERVARAFRRRLRGRYDVRESILFGSRARHAHRPDSDADIAVVLRGPCGDRTAAALDMAALAFDVLLETGVLVEALPLWEDEFKHPERFSNPGLIRNIQREGIKL
ncbi:MAG: recombinase family protein [Hyphomicrobiales bacterium]|nr:recombinase family protein [Hyphomicrobiales bacterium]